MSERRSDDTFSPPWTKSGPREVASDPGALDEEFLYHLSRGSEFLIANQVVEAKEELERALAYRPLDARSQDLLASVYFRLGVYPRAIEIWQNLVTTHGDDTALRVNLGLALLKTAQPELALTHLAKAVARDPHHERAWRYVGLAEWRVGNLDRAREAFLRGGQASMARRMEEMLGSSPGNLAVQDAVPYIEGTRLSLAPSAIRPSTEDGPPAAAVIVTSLAPAPLPSMAPAELAPEAPRARASTPPRAPLAAEAPPDPRGDVFALTHDGLLIATPHRALASRKSGLRVMVGQSPEETLAREDGGALGEQDPFFRFAGQRALHFAPSSSERFELRRVSDGPLHVLERALFAFDAALAHRTSMLSGPGAGVGPSARVVQLSGEGLAVLRVERPLGTLLLPAADETRVLAHALVAWSGHFTVSAEDERWVILRGSGTIHHA